MLPLGLLLFTPQPTDEDPYHGTWNEITVLGKALQVRSRRSDTSGRLAEGSNVLRDGS
jgi:hypothetical protein